MMLELLGGKSSFSLGVSLAEMYGNYARYLGGIENRQNENLYTMNDLFHKFIKDELPKLAEEHSKRMNYKLNLMMAALGNIPIHMVTPQHVRDYKEIRDKDGLVASNRDLDLLSGIFNKAKALGYKGVIENPCIAVERNPEKPRKLYLPLEEFARFYHFARERDPMLASYVCLLLVCGRRGGEMTALRNDGISEKGLIFEILKKRTEDDDVPERRLVMANKILSEEFERLNNAMESESENRLRSAKDKNKPVQNKDCYFGDLTRGAMHKRVERMRDKAIKQGVIKVRFRCQDLRSVGASFLELEEACKFLAHKDVNVTKRHYWRGLEKISALDLSLADG